MKLNAPAADRNRAPILEVLAGVLPSGAFVLEVASGSGQHAVFMAAAMPAITWQPTDMSAEARASIAAWYAESGLTNILPPLPLDVLDRPWPVARADAIVAINLVHISPWSATEALMAGAAECLTRDGILYLYGPYSFGGVPSAPSNVAFDVSLRARNPEWGVRDVDDLCAVAERNGLMLTEAVAMPANNHSLVFRRRTAAPAR